MEKTKVPSVCMKYGLRTWVDKTSRQHTKRKRNNTKIPGLGTQNLSRHGVFKFKFPLHTVEDLKQLKWAPLMQPHLYEFIKIQIPMSVS